jgi:hypothetical protein
MAARASSNAGSPPRGTVRGTETSLTFLAGPLSEEAVEPLARVLAHPLRLGRRFLGRTPSGFSALATGVSGRYAARRETARLLEDEIGRLHAGSLIELRVAADGALEDASAPDTAA